MRTSILLVVAIAATVLGSGEVAAKKVPLPALSDLAGVWLGGTDGSLEYFRLELRRDGTGNLAVQYLPREPAVAYSIASTRLSGYSVAFSVTPIDTDAEPIILRGQANSYRLS